MCDHLRNGLVKVLLKSLIVSLGKRVTKLSQKAILQPIYLAMNNSIAAIYFWEFSISCSLTKKWQKYVY